MIYIEYPMIKKILQYIINLHKDSLGKNSWTRVISSIIIINILLVWDIKCLRLHDYIDIGTGTMLTILSVLGVKVANKAVEESSAIKQKELEE